MLSCDIGSRFKHMHRERWTTHSSKTLNSFCIQQPAGGGKTLCLQLLGFIVEQQVRRQLHLGLRITAAVEANKRR